MLGRSGFRSSGEESMGFLGKLTKILGVITDILLIGRNRGLWMKEDEPGQPVQFSRLVNTQKGVQAALWVALAAALYEGGGIFLSYFDTPEELAAVGAPQVVIPVLVALGAMLRNYIKHRPAG
jgi:hypothetical protein